MRESSSMVQPPRGLRLVGPWPLESWWPPGGPSWGPDLVLPSGFNVVPFQKLEVLGDVLGVNA